MELHQKCVHCGERTPCPCSGGNSVPAAPPTKRQARCWCRTVVAFGVFPFYPHDTAPCPDCGREVPVDRTTTDDKKV